MRAVLAKKSSSISSLSACSQLCAGLLGARGSPSAVWVASACGFEAPGSLGEQKDAWWYLVSDSGKLLLKGGGRRLWGILREVNLIVSLFGESKLNSGNTLLHEYKEFRSSTGISWSGRKMSSVNGLDWFFSSFLTASQLGDCTHGWSQLKVGGKPGEDEWRNCDTMQRLSLAQIRWVVIVQHGTPTSPPWSNYTGFGRRRDSCLAKKHGASPAGGCCAPKKSWGTAAPRAAWGTSGRAESQRGWLF